MTQNTVKTRICLISDTHTSTPNPPQATSNAYRYPLPKADILLHAGDITKVGYKHEHEEILAMLKDADAELKIVIAGNHDITLDEEYYNGGGNRRHSRRMGYTAALDRNGDQSQGQNPGDAPLEDPKEIKALYTHPDTLAAGIRYLDEGTYTFTLSTGARFTIYASPYSPEFCNWAFAYDRAVDRYNPSPPVSRFQAPNPIPSHPAVDLMLTHGPPYGIFDTVQGSKAHVGCENLLRATKRARPRLHVFGHIHEAYGGGRMDWKTSSTKQVEEIRGDPESVLENRCVYVDASDGGKQPLRFGEETLFVNASVVSIRYHAVNAPWLVDLDLPVGGEE